MKSLREILGERAGRARALDPDDAWETVREFLAAAPANVEELLPGYQLIPPKVSQEEKIRRMTEAGVAKRQAKASERHAKVLPLIEEALKRDPAISLRELASMLDASGILPARSKRWSAASVQFVIRNAGVKLEPPQT